MLRQRSSSMHPWTARGPDSDTAEAGVCVCVCNSESSQPESTQESRPVNSKGGPASVLPWHADPSHLALVSDDLAMQPAKASFCVGSPLGPHKLAFCNVWCILGLAELSGL